MLTIGDCDKCNFSFMINKHKKMRPELIKIQKLRCLVKARKILEYSHFLFAKSKPSVVKYK